MELKQLSDAVATKAGLSTDEADKIVSSLFEVIADQFKAGEKVVIAEFGSFYINDDKTVEFSPSAKLKEKIL